MEKPEINRRTFLRGVAGVVMGAGVSKEVMAREPDTAREVGPLLQFGTYFDFVARFNEEEKMEIIPHGIRSGASVVLHLRNVNGNEVELPILNRPASEHDYTREANYPVFREMLLDYVRRSL